MRSCGWTDRAIKNAPSLHFRRMGAMTKHRSHRVNRHTKGALTHSRCSLAADRSLWNEGAGTKEVEVRAAMHLALDLPEAAAGQLEVAPGVSGDPLDRLLRRRQRRWTSDDQQPVGLPDHRPNYKSSGDTAWNEPRRLGNSQFALCQPIRTVPRVSQCPFSMPNHNCSRCCDVGRR